MSNNIPFWNTIKFKYGFIVSLTVLFLFLGMFLFFNNRYQRIQEIYQERTSERKENFEVISSLGEQKLQSLAIENTYWDDMVECIEQPEPSFERDLLQAQLETYEADVVWIYDKNQQMVTNISTLNKQLDPGFSSDELKTLFKKNYLTHFYRDTDEGVLEVHGATVHNSDDVEHKTPAKGYYFIARVLDEEYISKLESSTKDAIELTPVGVSSSLPPSEAKKGIITFTNALKDESGTPVADIHGSYRATAIADAYSSLARTVPIAIFFQILIVLTIYSLLHRLIVRPLNIIYLSLRKEDPSMLNDLGRKETEFGRIASLIIKSENQKKEILDSSAKMKMTQEALQIRSREIEAINSLMVNRELRMVDLKEENIKLKRAKK